MGKLLGSCLKEEVIAETFVNLIVSRLFPVASSAVEMEERSQELPYSSQGRWQAGSSLGNLLLPDTPPALIILINAHNKFLPSKA